MQEQYGDMLLQPPFSEAASPYYLHQALTRRQPPLAVSAAAVKEWFKKYRGAAGAQSQGNAQDLEDKYGEILRDLVWSILPRISSVVRCARGIHPYSSLMVLRGSG